MSKRTHMDDVLRGRIIGRLECGRSQSEISRELSVPQTVISRLWKRFLTNPKDVSRHFSTGRPRAFTDSSPFPKFTGRQPTAPHSNRLPSPRFPSSQTTERSLPDITLDLAFTRFHVIVFHVHFTSTLTEPQVRHYADQVLLPKLQLVLPTELKCYTLLLSTRPGGGLHVHLPELRIAHDDYVLLCARLQSRLDLCTSPLNTVRVEGVVHFSRATDDQSNTPAYHPFRVVYVEHSQVLLLPLHDQHSFDAIKHIVRHRFKPKKFNRSALFRRLIRYDSLHDVQHLLVSMMPPYIDATRTTVGYRTTIDSQPLDEYESVAHFVLVHQQNGVAATATSIFKAPRLSLLADAPFTFSYLSRHATHIRDFSTENRALRVWYERYHHEPHFPQDAFCDVNQSLFHENSHHFRDNPHPLASLMQFNKGYYFIPVFYALVNHLGLPPAELVHRLRPLLLPDAVSSALLDRLDAVPALDLAERARGFTLDTVLYCGSNMWPKPRDIEKTIHRILEDMRSTFLVCQSVDDMLEMMKRIQQRFLPIRTIQLDVTNTSFCILWNLELEQWQSASNADIANVVQLLFRQINRFARLNDKTLQLKSNSVNEIVASIAASASMEVKVVHPDQHKWFLKTHAGVQDLLTGHVGGTVPEFYLCENELTDVA